MKALLTSRSEIGWVAVAIPTLIAAHWLLGTVCTRFLSLLPESLRAVLHLL